MQTVVIKIGGSVLSPSPEILFDYIHAQKIKAALMPLTQTHRFILSIGGGALAKVSQGIVREHGGTEREINWAGTSACNHNAVMMRVALGDDAEDHAVTFNEVCEGNEIQFSKSFLCVGANAPGHSSDVDAVIMANNYVAKTILSLKNVDGVYTDDPNKDPDAKKIEDMSWEEYKGIIKTEIFTPKMAVPVDPIATNMAIESGITFKILDGSDLENMIHAIMNKPFIGSTIHP